MKRLEDYEYFRTDYGTLYLGDCLEVLPLLENDTIDLVITSPPYNLGIEYEGYSDNMQWDDYFKWCERWCKELFRVLKLTGRFCLNHYLSYGNAEKRIAPIMTLNTICENIGFKHHGLVIWYNLQLAKWTAWGSWLSANAPYVNSPFEGILILYKGEWNKNKPNKKSDISQREFIEACSGLWKLPTPDRKLHPANFPIELPLRCLRLLSFQGDLVIDPFLGSGTTAIACEMLRRKWIGIEISKEYCDIAVERLKKWKGQQRLFDFNTD